MSKLSPRLRQAFTFTPVAAALALAGCGGGSSSAPTTTVSGSVVKGPVGGSQVCAYAATTSGKGTQLGCTTTNASGVYSLEVQASGDVIIEATGGTYTDEATSTTKTLGDPMQVVVGSGGTVTGVVTPLTTVAYSVAKGGSSGVSASSFGTAITQVATSFGLTGTNLATTVPTVTGTPDAYGRMLRAVSQYVKDGGTLANILGVKSPTELQAGLQTAYLTINGSNITLNLGSLATATTTTGGSTGGTSTGSGLTVSFAVGGVGGASIPSVTIPGVPAPAAGTFCSSLTTADTALAGLKALGSVSIGSCTASGNTYTVQMTVSASGLTIPYTVTYKYG